MKVRDIWKFVASIDPDARHYSNPHDGTNYTVWAEYERIGIAKDDEFGDGWKFQIDRFTKTEYDEIAEMLDAALLENPCIAYTYMVEYEQDSKYIHHIFDCEGV